MKGPSIYPLIFAGALVCACLLAGCSGVQSRQQADELATARQDDAYCAGQTARYPDPAYISCRYQLQNARSYRKWKNAQMMLRTGNVTNQNITNPMFSRGIFTPMDRTGFGCQLEQHSGFDYVVCGEQGKP